MENKTIQHFKREVREIEDILNAREAAQIIGCSEQRVRIRMQRKLWDLGNAFPPSKTGKKEWTYEVYRKKLENFIEETRGGDPPCGT